MTDQDQLDALAAAATPRPYERYGYGDAGHKFDPDRDGRCRKRWAYCDGTRTDPQHDLRAALHREVGT